MNGEQALAEVRRLTHDDLLADYSDLHRALRRYCRITGFSWLRDVDDAALTFKDGVRTYTLADLELRKVERIWVQSGVDNTWIPLDEADELAFETIHNESIGSDGTTETNRPTHYRWTGPLFTVLTVTPTPDQDYSGRIDGIVNTPAIGRLTELPGPLEYHDLVPRFAAGLHYQHLSAAKLREGVANEAALLAVQALDRKGKELQAEAIAEMQTFAVRDSEPNRMSSLQWTKTKIAR